MRTIRLVMASILALSFLATSLHAQEHPEHPAKSEKATTAAAEVIEATVEGENFCLGCSLKKNQGAAAQCSKYGHRHALKVSAATADGKDLPQMKGWVLHYLDTDKAQPVIKEHHNESLSIVGKVYADERVFEVGELKKTKEPEHPDSPEHPEHPK